MSTASFSILINGASAGFFRSARGLRQGNPLSPYLFVLGMDILSHLINKVVEGNFLSGCKFEGVRGDPLSPYLFVLGMDILSRLINKAMKGNFLSGCKIGGVGGEEEEEELELSHLLYANDTLLFCKDNPDHLAFFGWILMWFKALSGLKINLGKNEIFPIGGRVNVEALTEELGCKVGLLPTMYLGLPLGAPHKSVRMWDPIEERFRRRLATWKRQYISKGGRVTVI